MEQLLLHPSPFTEFPSSHYSDPITMPSPHTVEQVTLMMWYPLIQLSQEVVEFDIEQKAQLGRDEQSAEQNCPVTFETLIEGD